MTQAPHAGVIAAVDEFDLLRVAGAAQSCARSLHLQLR
jgi:hypothetical protein